MQRKIAMIGLGYVGLPLAVEFGKFAPTIGFDIDEKRINELRQGHDRTLEVSDAALQAATQLTYTADKEHLRDADFFIVTVPTPIDRFKKPDLTPVIKATETVASVLSHGAIVVFESTVYPGVTEEICVPILERISGLQHNRDFYTGYSPERINPGDKEHTVTKIKKVVAASTPEILEIVDAVYCSVITAGTHRAPSIKVAEAAKVIENTQRDVNIALINELARLFNRLDINTYEVLKAAGTKWNFLPFRPGLVGGHCIGVDPYYLPYKAEEVGYKPEIILAGRRMNDGMGKYVAEQSVKLMVRKGIPINGAKALIMGITFKENCPDIRNTRVVDIIAELKDYRIDCDVYDPWADAAEVKEEFGLAMHTEVPATTYDLLIIAVAHEQFQTLDMRTLRKDSCVVYDVKNVIENADATL
jgi:UDP-N-acetyl-D-galactosamine dehydrogenase